MKKEKKNPGIIRQDFLVISFNETNVLMTNVEGKKKKKIKKERYVPPAKSYVQYRLIQHR